MTVGSVGAAEQAEKRKRRMDYVETVEAVSYTHLLDGQSDFYGKIEVYIVY